MTLLETAAVAFAMFSAVPVPQPVWNEKKHAVRAVRLSAGGGCVRPCLVGLGGFGGAAFIPALLRAAGLCLAPVLVTGGIHRTATPTPAMRWQAAPRRKKSRRY